MNRKISVVIPLYNHAIYIDEAVYSVLVQTYPATEIIVIDDGSSDASFRKVQNLARLSRSVVVWSHRNRGAHATLNAGVHRATGDIIAILNSDDAYEPERLERCVEVFDREPAVDAVLTGLNTVDKNGEIRQNAWLDQALDFFYEDGDLGRTLINGNIFVTTSNLIARRELFSEIGGFSELRYAHDLDFFLRLVAEGKTVRPLGEPLLRYRLHETNTISESNVSVKVEWAMVTAFFLHLQGRRLGWAGTFRYLDLLQKHDLLPLVAPMLGYFGDYPAETLERHRILKDSEFRTRVREAIR